MAKPSAIDQRRLQDGERAITSTEQLPGTLDEVKQQLAYVGDAIAALQSLDDLGPEANERASRDQQILWQRYNALEQRLIVLTPKP
jgi:hypothetical protein